VAQCESGKNSRNRLWLSMIEWRKHSLAQCDSVVETQCDSVGQSGRNRGNLSVTEWLNQRVLQYGRMVETEGGSV